MVVVAVVVVVADVVAVADLVAVAVQIGFSCSCITISKFFGVHSK